MKKKEKQLTKFESFKQRIVYIFKNVKKNITNYYRKAPLKTKIAMIVIVILLIPALVTVGTLSKYVFESIRESYFKSNDFYFYSDDLNGDNYQLNDWDGVSNYNLSVDVRNYIDDLRWTRSNIPYEISLTCSSPVGEVTCIKNDGIILFNNQSGTKNTINITLSNSNNLSFNDNDYVDMEMSMTSIAPYSKTLSASYRIFVSSKSVMLKINDAVNQEYFDLILSNNLADNKKVVLSWDYNIVSVDNTNDVVLNNTLKTFVVNNITYISGITIDNMPKKTTYSIRFYKKDKSMNYSYPLNGGLNNPIIEQITS